MFPFLETLLKSKKGEHAKCIAGSFFIAISKYMKNTQCVYTHVTWDRRKMEILTEVYWFKFGQKY